MDRMWRCCCDCQAEGKRGVVGCYQLEYGEWVTRNCIDCHTDSASSCPPDTADESTGLCKFHLEKAIAKLERRKLCPATPA